MSGYDLLIVVGTALMLVAVVMIFAAGWSDRSNKVGLAVFLVSGLFLVVANAQAVGGMEAWDIPQAYGKVIGHLF